MVGGCHHHGLVKVKLVHSKRVEADFATEAAEAGLQLHAIAPQARRQLIRLVPVLKKKENEISHVNFSKHMAIRPEKRFFIGVKFFFILSLSFISIFFLSSLF